MMVGLVVSPNAAQRDTPLSVDFAISDLIVVILPFLNTTTAKRNPNGEANVQPFERFIKSRDDFCKFVGSDVKRMSYGREGLEMRLNFFDLRSIRSHRSSAPH